MDAKSPLTSISADEAHNVLIVGETGVGKSSIINLIAGEPLATVNYSANGCTLEATPYLIKLQGCDHPIRLFDTVGVNEAQLKKKDYLSAIEKANKLIGGLHRTGGISLLLFCIRGGRITQTTQNNYHLFCDILCQNKVPVALLVTGLENVEPMDEWWKKNESIVKSYGLTFASHACITSIRGFRDCFAEQYSKSQITVQTMLSVHVTGNHLPCKPEREGWFIAVAGWLLKFLGDRESLKKKKLARHLHEKCSFTEEDAARLADSIQKVQHPSKE